MESLPNGSVWYPCQLVDFLKLMYFLLKAVSVNVLSQERYADVRTVPLSNQDLQWSSKQLVSNALVQRTIQQLIWKPSYYSAFAQESHYRAKAQIVQARRRKKILSVSPFKGLLKWMEKPEYILERMRPAWTAALSWIFYMLFPFFMYPLCPSIYPSPVTTSSTTECLRGCMQGENKAPVKRTAFTLHTTTLLTGITRN